jgi:UDP-N-acetylmuramoyl-tripeptide--D-alanyl-D-alanine ligase
MGELGEASAEAHRETGRLAATLGIDRIFAVGEQAETVAAGATERGMDPAHVFAADSWEKTAERLDRELRGGERVLVKGSRAMRMERIVEHLTHSDGGHG